MTSLLISGRPKEIEFEVVATDVLKVTFVQQPIFDRLGKPTSWPLICPLHLISDVSSWAVIHRRSYDNLCRKIEI